MRRTLHRQFFGHQAYISIVFASIVQSFKDIVFITLMISKESFRNISALRNTKALNTLHILIELFGQIAIVEYE